jgi:hypothetical protein
MTINFPNIVKETIDAFVPKQEGYPVHSIPFRYETVINHTNVVSVVGLIHLGEKRAVLDVRNEYCAANTLEQYRALMSDAGYEINEKDLEFAIKLRASEKVSGCLVSGIKTLEDGLGQLITILEEQGMRADTMVAQAAMERNALLPDILDRLVTGIRFDNNYPLVILCEPKGRLSTIAKQHGYRKSDKMSDSNIDVMEKTM